MKFDIPEEELKARMEKNKGMEEHYESNLDINKVCCENFYSFNSNDPLFRYPVIKIIKPKEEIKTRFYSTKKKFKFFLAFTHYYKFSYDLPKMVEIDHCPYCGVNLHKKYKEDSYANEIEGVTFNV